MITNEMTANLKNFICQEADEKEIELILNILQCAKTIGEPFYNEMNECFGRGDKKGMLEVIAKYTAVLKERATA